MTPSKRRSNCRRYINDRKLPDKAIDVIDETGLRRCCCRRTSARRRTIDVGDIEDVATMARIPPEDGVEIRPGLLRTCSLGPI
jgi:hypothetical protein